MSRSDSSSDGPAAKTHVADPIDLKRIVDLWLDGDWGLLASYGEAAVSHSVDKATIAAFIASAHHFCDDHAQAAKWAERALSWQCSVEHLARVLASGVQVTMARMAAIAGDAERARRHIGQTADPVAGELATARAQARLSRELASIGLLHLAGDVIEEDIEAVLDAPLGRVNRHRVNTLKSELKVLRHQLALAQSRGQMGASEMVTDKSDAERARQFSTSQLGQDIWVLERTDYKRNGFFVEFGATDGVLLSNTFLLETHFGWTGLLAEPNPDYFTDLKKNRSCQAFDACISARTGDEVKFVMADEFGGMADYISRDHHADRRSSYAQIPDSVLVLTTVSLDDFLKQHEAPKRIDYISVDTEGSELDILSAFPFEEWDVQMWSVEHNFTEDRDRIYELMSSHGYLRQEARFDDWYYKADSRP